MNVLLLGGRGYTASTLLHILLRHPYVETITISSQSVAGEMIHTYEPSISPSQLEKLHTKEYQSTQQFLNQKKLSHYSAIFSALPHGIIVKHASHMLGIEQDNTVLAVNSIQSAKQADSPVLIDLSADFRLQDINNYKKYYDMEHPDPKLLQQSIYGLSEWYRHSIPHATIIANPGCYPTSTLLPLLPIVRNCKIEGLISIHSISGISGAGRSLKENLLFCEQNENISAYSSGLRHRHVPEIQQILCQLGTEENATPFVFTPHLAPINQGMFTTITVPLSSKQESLRAKEALHAQYIGEHFVKVIEKTSNNTYGTASVQNTNHAIIYAHCEDNCIILHCAIDNLWKGATGQAVQNFNIYFGFEENTGLE